MSERAKKAAQNYFTNLPCPVMQIGERYWFIKGYEQAEKQVEKDVIERIVRYLGDTDYISTDELIEWIEDWQNESSDNPDGIYRVSINCPTLY